MKTVIAIFVVLASTLAIAQTCIVAAPAAPPTPRILIVKFPNPDGGYRGCTVQAPTNTGALATDQLVSQNARCDAAGAMAVQAAANDNGWADGGVP